jgi:hypothetical protein
VSITGFRSASPDVLEALVAAHDPQGETLSGKVVVEAPVTLLDALETGDCGRGYSPGGTPGAGIAFTNGAFGSPNLFDLDFHLHCDDGVADFVLAYGPCDVSQGGFDTYLPLVGLTPPFTICVRPTGQTQGGIDWTILAIEPGSATIHVHGSGAVLTVPFASGLPNGIDISALAPGKTYSLVIDATDGNTIPVSASGDFQHAAERTLSLVTGSGPHAVIAAPASAECTGAGGAVVTLDGSASADPDSTPGTNDDIAAFDWYESYGLPGQWLLGSGATLSVGLSLGSHAITLVVTDRAGQPGIATTTVVVRDTLPPSLTLHTDTGTLWPPNHSLVPVNVTWVVVDACDPAPGVQLISLTSSEPDDTAGGTDGATTGDIRGASVGTADTAFFLRAERDGQGSGRVYTFTYGARDASGNPTTAVLTVTVPHDQGQGPEPLQMRVEPLSGGAAGGSNAVRIYWPEVAGAIGYDVITGDLGNWWVANGALDVGRVQVLARSTTATSLAEPAGAGNPPTGHATFYLIQQRTASGGAGYGTETAPLPRVATTCDGGCPGAPPPSGLGQGTTIRK